MIHAQISQATALRYRIETIRCGEVVDSRPWVEHMITDAGLENLAANFGISMLALPILGDAASPTPVRRDGGSILFSQSADVVSADGAVSFFVAADVGRLLKFGTGTEGAECYVSEYISASSVRVDRSATITSQAAVIWYVNTAAILSPISGLTWSVVAGGAYNYTTGTVSGDVETVTHQLTRVSSAFAAAKTITEIAFTSAGGGNAGVFDRDTIQPGAGVLVGDQARVTVQLIYKLSGVAPRAVADFGVGVDTAGQLAFVSSYITDEGGGLASVRSDGQVMDGILDPSGAAGNMRIKAINVPFGMPGFQVASSTYLGGDCATVTIPPYVAGSGVMDCSASFSTAGANGTIYGFALCLSSRDLVIHKLATPFTKTNAQTLAITFRKSFRRLLNN